MIRFKSIDEDNYVCQYSFKNKEEIEKEWYSEECRLPSNDDPVIESSIDNKRLDIPNNTIFLDFLEMIGIDTSL